MGQNSLHNARVVAGAMLAASLLVACAHSNTQPVPSAVPDEADSGPNGAPPEQAVIPEQIEFRVLRVAYDGAKGPEPQQSRTRSQAAQRAELIAQLARGRSSPLAELVHDYGDASLAKDATGIVRMRPSDPGHWNEAVVQAALALRVGAVSDPVDTPEGYYIVKRLKDPPPGPERIAARHILIGYQGSPQAVTETTRTADEARALAEEISTRAKAPDGDWNALAAEYTDEPGSDQTGGDLGKFGRGRMVPAFERVAFKLEVGEISGAVQSPFGFHVIQRYE